MPHKCPRPPCDKQVADDQLACRPHWFELPKAMRDEIWAAYREDGPGTGRHSTAITEAVDWYRERAQERQDG